MIMTAIIFMTFNFYHLNIYFSCGIFYLCIFGRLIKFLYLLSPVNRDTELMVLQFLLNVYLVHLIFGCVHLQSAKSHPESDLHCSYHSQSSANDVSSTCFL